MLRLLLNHNRLSLRWTSRRRQFSYHVPIVIERNGMGERAYDIYSRLLKDRIVCLHSDVNSQVTSSLIAQLLFLEAQDRDKPIYLYINSPGGTVTDGFAIYDTIQYIKPPVHTVCMGMAASFGAVLLTAGAQGQRFALPNARIMLHQPHGGATGQASDIAIQAQEILRTRRRLNEVLAKHTGQSVERIDQVMERDYYMSGEEAVEFGLIDKVIEKREL